MVYDYAVIGSGFGGSVAALRLGEKGYKVAVIEQGGWVTAADMEEANSNVRYLNWLPAMGMSGYCTQSFFRHVAIVGATAVGGGSIVYAAVLLKPKDAFYGDPAWSNLGINWKEDLAPHYETAARMLGVVDNPHDDIQDDYLRETARQMGAAATYGPTPNGIYFGAPQVRQGDPFFNGSGPSRVGCHLCGRCLTGCPHGSKNSLDRNYLYLAQRLGVDILPHRKVTGIVSLEDGGYQLNLRHPLKRMRKYPDLKAHKVIVAAGVLGTLELLFRCRDVTRTLPRISAQLGQVVRTNSEAVVGVLARDEEVDLTRGTTISSHFYPDEHTHITQNRFPRGYSFMRWFTGPLVDHPHPGVRSLKALAKIFLNPLRMYRLWFKKNWYQRVTILTVMQHLDNRIAFEYCRRPWTLFKRGLKSVAVQGKSAPTNLPVANRAAAMVAKISGGEPLSVITESVGNISMTAHILGGCHMGNSAKEGVIDTSHQVFGYPGLYVVNGASVSANIGANPSLTIAAMAERAMSLIPPVQE
ncbi:MAG: GMC family oxidoreductase [Desulfobacterales bacterium]|nr:GMC family oxidoreductase [Desulfobacterales bacterium]